MKAVLFGHEVVEFLGFDNECADYFGCTFLYKNNVLLYRKAKATPKKAGYFVTLWKRDAFGKPVPYHEVDQPVEYIIVVEWDTNIGAFVFPKQALVKYQVLSTATREGKRGFRLYAPWDFPESKQAQATKKWQSEYFRDMSVCGCASLFVSV
ncbi:MepB family protein [Sphingobacterium suaedae]|uniref:MepB family protein n=1 Tax=Sphingobacterium suaedae TaxID=1686402 RepID=A0ABW5KH58_9SPHI